MRGKCAIFHSNMVVLSITTVLWMILVVSHGVPRHINSQTTPLETAPAWFQVISLGLITPYSIHTKIESLFWDILHFIL